MKNPMQPPPPLGDELLPVIEGIAALDRHLRMLRTPPASVTRARERVDLVKLIQKVAAGALTSGELDADELSVLLLVASIGMLRGGSEPADVIRVIHEGESAAHAYNIIKRAAEGLSGGAA